jgi:hypothetical protein
MFPKYLQRIGLIACLVLVVACFMPWTYHADLKETFTGFYSHDNHYGKPGLFLTGIAVIAFAFMYIPKVWAKRINLFVCAVGVGYAIKSYTLFTSCYNAYCPEKRTGIFLIMICTVIMLAASVFPDLKIKDKKHQDNLV